MTLSRKNPVAKLDSNQGSSALEADALPLGQRGGLVGQTSVNTPVVTYVVIQFAVVVTETRTTTMTSKTADTVAKWEGVHLESGGHRDRFLVFRVEDLTRGVYGV